MNTEMQTKRIRLAKVIEHAAEYNLFYNDCKSKYSSIYSCIAVYFAFKDLYSIDYEDEFKYSNLKQSIDKILWNAGLPSFVPGNCFPVMFDNPDQAQDERYMWLKMLAQYCKTEDIRVTFKI